MMKKAIFFVLLLLATKLSFSQTNISDDEKLISLCKIWGFLKYYHPEVAKGKTDWDQALITHIDQLPQIKTKEQLSAFYIDWINRLGHVDRCKKCSISIPDSLKRNFDLSWINDKELFTDSLSSLLYYIQVNRNQGSNYYVSYGQVGNTDFSNEKTYPGYDYPKAEYRLLTLFRYWNIINYFYPYKYAVGEDWNNVLKEAIPGFKNASDTLDYHLAILKLVKKLNDSHAFFNSKYISHYFGEFYVPVHFKIIDNQVIATSYWSYITDHENYLLKGDRILKVNGRDILEILKERLNLTTASNEPTRLRNVDYLLFTGNSASVDLTLERNGLIKNTTLKRYLLTELKKDTLEPKVLPWKILDNNIGYIDMGTLKKDQVNDLKRALSGTKAMVFDIRGYPKGVLYKIADWLNPSSKMFVKIFQPDLSYPGAFKIESSLNCGEKNKDYYKGKVVLLVNEQTQSHAEFTTMALQTAPNVTTIGSQTAGADGNVVKIILPGGFYTYMSGLGIYYPNGKETQRVGITINIHAEPTVAGIKAGKDEVLERALTYLSTGK